MSKFRILSDNAADKATITTSSTAGSLVASNMKSNIKSRVWRSTSTTATITAIFDKQQLANGTILAFTNLTPGATLRVRAYTRDTDTTPIYDSNIVYGNPATPLGGFTWGEILGENGYSGEIPLSVNNFSQGRYSYARVWWNNTYLVRKVVIDISDLPNTYGYVEVGKLIIGNSWTPEICTEFGATDISNEDSSTSLRTDAGSVLHDIGTKHRKISVNFPSMVAEERNRIWKILRNSSITKPILVSVFSNNADTNLEQTFMLFGSISSNNPLGLPYSNQYFETNFEMEEI